MSAERLRALIAGGAWATAVTILCVFCYAGGRSSIGQKCLDDKMFVWHGDVFVCAPARTPTRVNYRDDI